MYFEKNNLKQSNNLKEKNKETTPQRMYQIVGPKLVQENHELAQDPPLFLALFLALFLEPDADQHSQSSVCVCVRVLKDVGTCSLQCCTCVIIMFTALYPLQLYLRTVVAYHCTMTLYHVPMVCTKNMYQN